MARLSVALLCHTCGRESAVPVDRISSSGKCRACGSPLPTFGVLLLPDDDAVAHVVEQSPRPMVLVVCGSDETLTAVRKTMLRAAPKIAGYVFLSIAQASACPDTVARLGVKSSPTWLLIASGRTLALREGGTTFEEVEEWLRETLLHYLMPPSRSKPAPCLRCGGRTLIRCFPSEHGVQEGDRALIRLRRMSVTFASRPQSAQKDFFGRELQLELDPQIPAGELEALVCRSCGHVEWFADRPEAIPIGLEHRTELIEVKLENPYR